MSRLLAEPFLVSVTRVALFRRCPLAYQRRYLLKEPEPDDAYAQLGRHFHAFAAAKESGLPLPSTPLLPPSVQADWELLRTTFEAQTFDDQHLVGVEEPVTMEWMDGATPVLFRGVLDRLEIEQERARVWDRKTGYRVANADELRDDLQLTAYGMLVCQRYPQVQVVECAQIQYRYGGRAVTVAFTREELEQHKARLVAEVGRMLRATEFPPGPTCTMCPPSVHIRALQPYEQVEVRFVGQDVTVDVAEPQTPEQALGVAQGIKLAEQLATAGKKALAKYAAIHGPVALGTAGAYAHWGEERLTCTDVDEFHKFLLDRGLSTRVYLRPDGRGAKALLKRFPEAQKFFVWAPGSKFGWRAHVGKAQQKTERIKTELAAPWVGNEG